jgi:hypothetical protein
MSTVKRGVSLDLRRVNCAEPGKGAWRLLIEPERRRVRVRHSWTKSTYTVFYGTRTQRTREDAEVLATALCATLNALKTRRC